MGRERKFPRAAEAVGSIEISITCHCKAEGTREVQTRKAVLASPACYALFRHQHLVASLLPAVIPMHKMNTQQRHHEWGSSERMCRQLFPATLQEARAKDNSPYSNTVLSRCSSPHPKASSICWPREEGMPHSEAPLEHTRQLSRLPLKI